MHEKKLQIQACSHKFCIYITLGDFIKRQRSLEYIKNRSSHKRDHFVIVIFVIPIAFLCLMVVVFIVISLLLLLS